MRQTVKTVAVPVQNERRPLKMLRRIGSSTYKVTIRFSDNATETAEDKLLRLMKREVNHA
jgi:hypothetical protein